MRSLPESETESARAAHFAPSPRASHSLFSIRPRAPDRAEPQKAATIVHPVVPNVQKRVALWLATRFIWLQREDSNLGPSG